MYAQVVVLTYQPPSVDSYSYEIPKDLDIKIGQLVEVPFGKRNPQGIVVGIHNNKPNVATKPITKIVLENPILLPYQIELLKWMSKYYIAPTVNCLEAMLPNIPKKIADSDTKAGPWKTERPGLVAQSLILTPSINNIAETLAKFPRAKNHIVYHNELKASEKFAAWQKIAAAEADYIFSSRAGIFVPCPNLKEIIIYDEHDGAYKDERSPYFDTLTIAQKICELTDAQLKIVDPSPRITTYAQLPNRIKIQTFPQKIQIVNMQNEKLSGRHSPISFDLEEEIENSEGNILLFLNKKKESGHMFCKSCKNSQYLDKRPQECPNCKSPDIFWNVLNTDSLKSEVKKLFPNKQIDINTALALYAPLVKKYSLIGHIQADSLLNIADYTSGEKLFAQITQLKKLLTGGGKLILQTYNFEHPTINAIEIGDYKAFFKWELQARKTLAYPPHSVLIKLILRGKIDDKVKKESVELFKKIKEEIEEDPITILGPYKPTFWQRQATYHIILKYKIESYSLKNRENAIEFMSKYLEKGNKTYTIEVEPEGIQ